MSSAFVRRRVGLRPKKLLEGRRFIGDGHFNLFPFGDIFLTIKKTVLLEKSSLNNWSTVFFFSGMQPQVSKWRHVYQTKSMFVYARVFRLILSTWTGEYQVSIYLLKSLHSPKHNPTPSHCIHRYKGSLSALKAVSYLIFLLFYNDCYSR